MRRAAVTCTGLFVFVATAAMAAGPASVYESGNYTLTIVRDLGGWQRQTVIALTPRQYEVLLPRIQARAERIGAIFARIEASTCGASAQNDAVLQQRGLDDVAAVLQSGSDNAAVISQRGVDDAAFTVQAGTGLEASTTQSGSHDITLIIQLNRCSRSRPVSFRTYVVARPPRPIAGAAAAFWRARFDAAQDDPERETSGYGYFARGAAFQRS